MLCKSSVHAAVAWSWNCCTLQDKCVPLAAGCVNATMWHNGRVYSSVAVNMGGPKSSRCDVGVITCVAGLLLVLQQRWGRLDRQKGGAICALRGTHHTKQAY